MLPQRRLVVSYRRFGATYRSPPPSRSLTSNLRCCNITEERRSHTGVLISP